MPLVPILITWSIPVHGPFWTAMAAGFGRPRAALWAHDYGLWTLAVGGGLLIYALFGWIHDILLEATVGKNILLLCDGVFVMESFSLF